MLPKSADIAKVISDDPTGDEEGLEELPEVSDKKNKLCYSVVNYLVFWWYKYILYKLFV